MYDNLREQPTMRDNRNPVPRPEEHVRDEDRGRWGPSANELRQRHEVCIRFLSRGCVIEIGCKAIAFNSVEEAMQEFTEYVKDPVAAYKRWAEALEVDF